MAEKKEARTYYLGTGRRKTAVARVRVAEGKGRIEVNGRPLDDYFTQDKDRGAVLGPMLVTDMANRLDVLVKVHGGGVTGQAGAISQGLARAIKTMFSPADEQKRFTVGNITAVRSRRVEKPAAAQPTPSADGAAVAEDSNIGMVKKLRDSGYLTRDSRMKERKKYGLRGARRGTQFSKR
ncbi:MAG TPA: 30S ribosomal protein S9 [Fimbriiglobus sp.]|jgi:small subunit ribosomal protein S9|nr:30S ribosomal protein S9 [Fimbriiglobus sp.]